MVDVLLLLEWETVSWVVLLALRKTLRLRLLFKELRHKELYGLAFLVLRRLRTNADETAHSV